MDTSTYIEPEARPGEPLTDHIKKGLQVFDDISPSYREVTNTLQRKTRENTDLQKVAFWTVACHDYGKSTVGFQGKCTNCGRYSLQKECPNCGEIVENPKSRIPHPLASFLATLRIAKNLTLPQVAGLLAIATHHSPLRPEKYQDYSSLESFEYISRKKLDTLLNSEHVERFGDGLLNPNSEIPPVKPVQTLHKILHSLPKSSKEDLHSLRNLYAYLKTMLHYCDWYSVKGKTPKISAPNLRESIDNFFKNRGWNPNKIQERLDKCEGNALLQAPCGSGKTEAALFWSGRNLRSHKIMYLLPTISTTNKMYERLGHFCNGDVDILHSYASYIREKEDESEKLDQHELKSFMSPVTVATVDQFLLHLFNWKRWDTTLGNSMNSLIILDEIHCYEPYTLGLIGRAFQELKDFPSRFLVMSATLPAPIESYLQKSMGPARSFSFRGSGDARVDVTWRESGIESSISEILKEAKNGSRVLVIANTIRKSKELYRELTDEFKDEKTVLFHGQFNIMDRGEKEDTLINAPEGFIAVTTQTVEVSLDLDFDALYTEIAPPDALIQRMGRVNRRGRRAPAKVYVHEAGMGSKMVYSMGEGKILDRTRDSLLEGLQGNRDLHRWIRDFYDRDWYRELLHKGIEESIEELEKLRTEKFKEIYSLLSESLEDISSLTRKSSYPTLNAVPAYHETEDLDLSEKLQEAEGKEMFDLIRNYSIKVHPRDELEQKNGYWIVDVPYSSEYGLLDL